MFDNIGRKIKNISKAICWVGIIASVLLGIVILMAGLYSPNGGAMIFIGLLVMAGGTFLSWVGSLISYGFGELVENSCIQTELMVKKELSKEEQKSE